MDAFSCDSVREGTETSVWSWMVRSSMRTASTSPSPTSADLYQLKLTFNRGPQGCGIEGGECISAA